MKSLKSWLVDSLLCVMEFMPPELVWVSVPVVALVPPAVLTWCAAELGGLTLLPSVFCFSAFLLAWAQFLDAAIFFKAADWDLPSLWGRDELKAVVKSLPDIKAWLMVWAVTLVPQVWAGQWLYANFGYLATVAAAIAWGMFVREITADADDGFEQGTTRWQAAMAKLLVLGLGAIIVVVSLAPPTLVGMWIYHAVEAGFWTKFVSAFFGGTLVFSIWGAFLLVAGQTSVLGIGWAFSKLKEKGIWRQSQSIMMIV